MSKNDHIERLRERTVLTQKELVKVAKKKIKSFGSANKAYNQVGVKVGRTGQQVRNIVENKIENPNGYLMESMIDAFNEL
jgi:hypothetical protein